MLLLIQPSTTIEWAERKRRTYEKNGRTNERKKKKKIYQLFPTSSSVTDRETTEWILWLVSLCDCNFFFLAQNFPVVWLFIGIFQYFLTHLTSSQTLALHSTFVIINYTGCRCRHRRRLLVVVVLTKTHAYTATITTSSASQSKYVCCAVRARLIQRYTYLLLQQNHFLRIY